MKLIIIPVLFVSVFLLGGSWISQGANDTIVTAYSYSSHAGIGADMPVFHDTDQP